MTLSRGAAIIGLAGRYSHTNTVEEFWDILVSGKIATSAPPADRTDITQWKEAYSIHGGFIEAVAQFDAEFFGIAPHDAAEMDPQQRLFLQTTWHAIENAGYTPQTLPRKTGVFVSAISGDYATLVDPISLHKTPGTRATDRYQIANRVSYCLDFTGPSVTVDTACSGSCVAIHTAIQSLENGDCEVAIVGGVNLFLHASRFAQYRAAGILSDDNVCRPFRDGANGVVYGEGVGAIVIRPALKAEANGDMIRAYIAGSSVNSSGRTQAFGVPSSKAQTDAIATALAKARISAHEIGVVEAHGTGTALGDSIEARAIADAFRQANVDESKFTVSLGSLKGHFGHLESAATIAAVTKVIFQMEHQTLVPSIPVTLQSRLVSTKRTPLVLQDKGDDWTLNPDVDRRYALITSVGGGGVNGSLVLAEACNPIPSIDAPYGEIFVFSARTHERLRELVEDIFRWLDQQDHTLDMNRLAITLQIGRVALAHRVAFTATTLNGLRSSMMKWLSDEVSPKSCSVVDGWLNGETTDWTAGLKRAELPRILQVPGYPFGGNSYWLLPHDNLKAEALHAD